MPLNIFSFFLKINEKLFIFINQKMANPILDKIVLFILICFFSLLILIPFWLLVSKKKTFLALYSLFCGFFLYWFGHSILKPIFDVPRPFNLIEETRILGPWHPSPYSFPSTTTMLVFGIAFPIFFRNKKLGSLFLVLSSLVGFSLIYTGFHTPLDVFGGIFFSFCFVFFLEKILKAWL